MALVVSPPSVCALAIWHEARTLQVQSAFPRTYLQFEAEIAVDE